MSRVQAATDEWEVPGLVAMVNYGRNKRCEVRDEVFHGAPNFVLDVFDSPANDVYLRRKERLARWGVQEYVLAVNSENVVLQWNRLHSEGYRLVEPDSDGIYRSMAMPNLWLPAQSVAQRDWWSVLGCIERGISRRADFS